MKTILFFSVAVFLFSCRTVHKATEDQITTTQKTQVAAGNSSEKQTQASSEVISTNTGIVASSDNGYERLIEEMVMEYSTPGKDSLSKGALENKVVKTTRTIKERGNRKDISVEQTTQKSGLRKFWNWLNDDEYRTADIEDLTMAQRKRLVERSGVPWYVWAGGSFSVSLIIWLTKKYQLNKARYNGPTNQQP